MGIPTGATDQSMRLAELLSARLCHDLGGLAGTLLGALELAAEDEDNQEEALSIAREASAALASRLKLLRAAWSGECGPLRPEHLPDLARGAAASERFCLDLTELDPTSIFGSGAARTVLNIVLLAGESLPGGGTLALSGSASQDILATIDGPKAAWPKGLAACLVDESAAWDALTSPITVQAPITALVAHAAGLKLSLMMPAGPMSRGPAPLLLEAAP